MNTYADNQFLFLIKNLRGLFLPVNDPDKDAELAVWLGRKFRYRTVGIPSLALSHYGHEKLRQKFSKKPFHILELPDWLQIPEKIASLTEPEVWQTIFLSCIYCTPVITSYNFLRDRSHLPFCLWSRENAGAVDDREIRFNLRLAEYAMTDFLQHLETPSPELLRTGENVKEWLAARRTVSADDGSTRFWRLAEQKNGNPGVRLMVAYLDFWQTLIDHPELLSPTASLLETYPVLSNISIWIGLNLAELFK